MDAEDAVGANRGKVGVGQADLLMQLAGGAELFHTAQEEAYATFRVGEHYQTWRIGDRGFRDWLIHLYFKETCKSPSAQAIRQAISVFQCRARFDGPSYPVFVRVAEYRDAIYIDLANERWEAVEVTAAGWRVVTNPLVKFRRPSGMMSLPNPVRGGSINELRQFVNIEDENDWKLLVGWVLATFRPRGPYPILVEHGEHGSAKSSTQKVLRRLVDPNCADLRAEPREPRDLVITASNGWVIALDNVSYIPTWLSDALCRLATGGGFGTRELYSDSEERIFQAQRPVLLNGIDEIVTRPDLLDRSVVLYLPRIEDNRRRPEVEFWREFECSRPRVLGALLDAIATAMRNVEKIELQVLPRMADFAVWVSAAECGLGWNTGEFMETYTGNRTNANELVLDASLLTPVIRRLAKVGWEGTATDLLAELARLEGPAASAKGGWPRNVRSLSSHLRRLAPNLRAAGIEVVFRKSGQRLIEVRKFAPAASTEIAGAPELKNERGGADPNPGCPWCGGTDRWLLADGSPVCAHCHPNTDDWQGEESIESKSWTQ